LPPNHPAPALNFAPALNILYIILRQWLANGLITQAILNCLAALKHHFFDRDPTLRRMLGMSGTSSITSNPLWHSFWVWEASGFMLQNTMSSTSRVRMPL